MAFSVRLPLLGFIVLLAGAGAAWAAKPAPAEKDNAKAEEAAAAPAKEQDAQPAPAAEEEARPEPKRTRGSRARREPPKEADAAPAEAEESKDEKRKAIAPSTLAPIESIGTLQSQKEGGLGLDFWADVPRSFLLQAIPELPVRHTYRTMLDLERRVLLSSIDAGLIDNDVPAYAGEDLLTVRMGKLLELGSFRDIVEIYSKYGAIPYSPELAVNSIKGMLYAGERPLACLELKSAGEDFNAGEFWRQTAEMCDYLLASEAGNPLTGVSIEGSKLLTSLIHKERFKFTPPNIGSLETLPEIEKAFLLADNRVDFSDIDNIYPQKISPAMLGAMLNSKAVTGALRMMVLRESVNRGLIAPYELEKVYKNFSLKSSPNSASLTAESAQGWQRLPFLFKSYGIAENKEQKWATVTGVLNQQPTSGWGPLMPFTPMVLETVPADLSSEPQLLSRAITLILLSNSRVSDEWRKLLVDNAKLSPYSGIGFKLHVLNTLVAAEAGDHEAVLAELAAFRKKTSPHTAQIMTVLAGSLDRNGDILNNPASTYEKEFRLTSDGNYVMPTDMLWNQHKQAREKKSPGMTVVLSIFALEGIPPKKLHPGLLAEVLDGFAVVGLNSEARKLAVEVAVGLSETRGEN